MFGAMGSTLALPAGFWTSSRIGLFYIKSLKMNTYLELGVPLCLGKFDLSIYSGSQVIMRIWKNEFMMLNLIKIKNKSILVVLMMIVSMIERWN